MTRPLQYQLNRLAKTLVQDQPTRASQDAANVYAGTTNLSILGALNAKNGSTNLDLQGVLNALAGTTGLAYVEAAESIPTPP